MTKVLANTAAISRRKLLEILKDWGLGKKLKREQLKVLLEKKNARLDNEGKDTEFLIHGQPLTIERLDRSIQRSGCSLDSDQESPSTAGKRMTINPFWRSALISQLHSNASRHHIPYAAGFKSRIATLVSRFASLSRYSPRNACYDEGRCLEGGGTPLAHAAFPLQASSWLVLSDIRGAGSER